MGDLKKKTIMGFPAAQNVLFSNTGMGVAYEGHFLTSVDDLSLFLKNLRSRIDCFPRHKSELFH
jgi:hypothetical protein